MQVLAVGLCQRTLDLVSAQQKAWRTRLFVGLAFELGDFFETVDVRKQLIVVGHAAEVPTDHFVRSASWLATGPEADHHTSDDRAVGLNLNALLRLAQQVAAAE